jgi:hypothetical protein
METGAFAMFDALGTKGVWAKHNSAHVIKKFEAIAELGRGLVDQEFGGPDHPNMRDESNCVKMVRVGFVSDTVVVALVTKDKRLPVFATMVVARYASAVLRLGLQQLILPRFRGHQKSHESAVGVFIDGTKAKEV